MVFPHIKKEHNLTQIKCFTNAFLLLLVETGLIFNYIFSQHQTGNVIMIGSVTAIYQYLNQMMDSFLFYSGDYESVINWKTDFEAIKPIIDMPIANNQTTREIPAEWHSLQIRSLSFSHRNGASGLQDIALELAIGRRIAIVGESGAGKSTLLQVLRGLLPAPGATLEVDGGKAIPIHSLSGTTTLIPQDPEILENTIRYNIIMGMSASEESLQSALSVSCFDEVAGRLPRELESDIREKGVNLSGGEKQRLSLARGAFAVKDSSVVLLDEPTSSVDPATELKIFHRLFEFLSERCVVCALHRLHLVRHFDHVYVLSQGKLVEEGTFDQLCQRRGEFARL